MWIRILSRGRRVLPRHGTSFAFFHKVLEVCHDDDFLIVGRKEVHNHVLCLLQGADELSQVTILGLESAHSQAASFLDCSLTMRKRRIENEPDQQQCGVASS